VRLADLIDVTTDAPAAAELLAELQAHGTHLEICPTINLHTGAAVSLALHPIHALWRAGVSLSFHTDNRLMSRVDHSTEAVRLVQAGFGWNELVQMGLEAAQASFLPEAARQGAIAALRGWAVAEGLAAVRT